MTALRTAALVAMAALAAACSQGQATTGTTTALTEANVRAFVEEMEKASFTEREDEVYGAALADDVRITWHAQGEPDETMTKDEFLEDPEGLDHHEYAYDIGEIAVAADGKSATVAITGSESFGFEGAEYEIAFDQTYRIELRDGTPLVVALDGTETSVMIDGEEQL